MSKAKKGNTVSVHYIGKTADDTVFSSSIPGEPLELVIGNSVELSAFQKWVIGMEEGEKRTITVTPEEAFGERQNELVTAVNKSALPDNIVSTLGQLVQLKGADGRIVDVRIIGITEDMVVLDANHPLAGHTLKFEINMIEIKLFFNRINRRNIMLTVTENAEEKLKEHLQTKTDDPEIAIRLVASHSKSARLSLVLDKEQKGDKVVESKAGRKVLLISPDLASELKDLVIDYQETPQGSAFTISSPASST